MTQEPGHNGEDPLVLEQDLGSLIPDEFGDGSCHYQTVARESNGPLPLIGEDPTGPEAVEEPVPIVLASAAPADMSAVPLGDVHESWQPLTTVVHVDARAKSEVHVSSFFW